MAYCITNENLGTTIVVDELPAGVCVGVHDIGPSWNNQPPPKCIVEVVDTLDWSETYSEPNPYNPDRRV